ncbi:Ku protein [Aliihoeflea sp. 40Bstr573]|uniref:non-homologous end joining protein Ku n=1 Tax=Aliihoeflea sp. 40Bstr573 TaxID=2696467 RepID=UPI002094322A|nr:Ku protein [Aliihoeflea sp. 40Bstr573]MCO6386631.1 Ku protein [Aliihoeflea sp. 40Bstr573]
MAPRWFWKGYLKLSLVTCPISMTPATTANNKVRFHTINAKTGNRIESRYVDAVTGKPLGENDEIKGYEVGEDNHVMLDDDELDAVALESTRTIDIEQFVPADSIGWIWLDKPHYIAPDDKVGEEAFAVIRDAMRATKKVGISRVVLYRRERAVMLEPRGKGIVLWTLRYGDEVREETDYFSEIEKDKPDAKLMKLVKSLIDERSTKWDPKLVQDPVQDRLLKIIAAKKKRKKPTLAKTRSEPEPETPSNVVSIMDALKKSIASEKAGKKK